MANELIDIDFELQCNVLISCLATTLQGNYKLISIIFLKTSQSCKSNTR